MDGYICYAQCSYKHNLGIGDGKHLIKMTESVSPVLWKVHLNTTFMWYSPTTLPILSCIQRRKMHERFHICFQFLFSSGYISFLLISPSHFKIILRAQFMAMVIIIVILISQWILHLSPLTLSSLQIISFEFPNYRQLLPWSNPLLVIFCTCDSNFVRVSWC